VSQPPNPDMDRKTISRIGIAGAVIGIVSILLFMGLWILLGNANVDDFPRLVISVCVPPAIMTAIIGAYLLFAVTRENN